MEASTHVQQVPKNRLQGGLVWEGRGSSALHNSHQATPACAAEGRKQDPPLSPGVSFLSAGGGGDE